MRPKPRPKYRAGAARAKIERLHATKVKFLTGSDFRTRIHGTDKQVGQVFPVGSIAGKKLPKLRFKKPTRKEKTRLTQLEKRTLKEEDNAKAAFGKKAWACGVTYKDGTMDMFPVVASSYAEAIEKIGPKIERPEDVVEIVFCNPLGETLHKIGKAAVSAARKMRAFARKAARKLGRVAAIPAELREEYAAAKKERPWLTEEKFAKEKGAPLETVKEWREEPTPSVYRPAAVAAPPEEEYTPYQRKMLAAETEETMRREAERRAAPRIARPRLNGRSLRPFGVPLLDYQSGTSSERAAEREAQPSRVGVARRKAAWTERAPVKIER